MERLVFECAVRATFIAASTAFVLWVMKIRSASARHRAWTAVVLLMLVLPVWTAFGPDMPLRVLPPTSHAETSSTQGPPASLPPSSGLQSPVEMTPADLAGTPAAPVRRSVIEWHSLLLGIYLVGLSVMLMRLLIGTIQARRLIRTAILQDGRLTSSACNSPITVGWFDPVVILPIEWQQWPREQLSAILTHEGEHARRLHPFAQWMALLNRAVFWFHPLAWWLERKIAALSEEACDAAVLAAGHSPQDYSNYLLSLARSMMRDGKRVQIVGMAMPGSCLKTRIRQILIGIPAQQASRMRIGCTIAFCAVSSVVIGGARLAPREVTPALSTVAAIPVPLEMSPGSKPAAAEQQSLPSSSPGLLVAEAPGSEQGEILPATPPGAPERSGEEASILATPPQQETAVPATPPPSDPSLLPRLIRSVGGLTFRTAQMPGVWWTDPLLLSRLGLTDDQKAKIDNAFENHRQSIVSSRERLRNEEAQHARLLAADPVDEQAVLAQIDRVVQARGQMERASAAMNLEVRGYLTPSQWAQLRAQVPITSIDYVARLQIVPIIFPVDGPATHP
jgi:beta-lactamase regulating signal transducer with metallopeptidase domain